MGAYNGAKTGGTAGCLKGLGLGLGAGLIGGTAMVVGGVITGTMQIGRGLINTPGAMAASMSGKDFNEETREWHVYNLVEVRSTTVHTVHFIFFFLLFLYAVFLRNLSLSCVFLLFMDSFDEILYQRSLV